MTVRVDQELYGELKALKERTGQSVADILKVGLGRAQAATDQSWLRGYDEGYTDAKDEYEVTYWCSGCRRRHLSLNTHEQKEAAASMMYQAGWHDPGCP